MLQLGTQHEESSDDIYSVSLTQLKDGKVADEESTSHILEEI